jgi:homoserine kinase type II
LQRSEGKDNAIGVFYTIFDYLPGEDRYTWVDPVLNNAELYASGAVLAQFHIAAGSFTPRGRRVEPKILELLPVIAETWAGCPAKFKGSVFDERISERLDMVRTTWRRRWRAG